MGSYLVDHRSNFLVAGVDVLSMVMGRRDVGVVMNLGMMCRGGGCGGVAR